MEEKYDNLYEILKSAAKSQLHLHLDGSLSLEFIRRSYERMLSRGSDIDKIIPESTLHQWKSIRDAINFAKQMSIPEGELKNKPKLNLYYFCSLFLQSPDDIYDAVVDVTSRMYTQHHVNYLEVRLAPYFHIHEGYSISEIISAAVAAFEHAQKKFDDTIGGGIILCGIRSNLSQCYELLPEFERNAKLLGIDIAGNEQSFELSLFDEFLTSCKDKDIKITVHAGEFFHLHDNIRVASRFGVNRIGHALAVGGLSNSEVELLKRKNIAIEVILSENCGNKDKNINFQNHPISFMMDKGIRVAALNCDNLLDSGSKDIEAPNPTSECVLALTECKITAVQLFEIMKTGYEFGFGQNLRQKEVFEKTWLNSILPHLESILA